MASYASAAIILHVVDWPHAVINAARLPMLSHYTRDRNMQCSFLLVCTRVCETQGVMQWTRTGSQTQEKHSFRTEKHESRFKNISWIGSDGAQQPNQS